MNEKLHVVVAQVPGLGGEDSARPYAVGAYTDPEVARKVQRLAVIGAETTQVEVDLVPPGIASQARAQGVDMPEAGGSSTSWQEVHKELLERYRDKCRHNIHALEERLGRELAHRTLRMCDHMLEEGADMPEDKASRWLGFVQGMLTAARVLSVEAERDFTRPMFHFAKGPSPSHSV